MNNSLRYIGLCVSSLVFVALLGYVFLVAAKAQPGPVQCPCDYDIVPKTLSCWLLPYPDQPVAKDTQPICSVTNFLPEGPAISLGTDNPNNTCGILVPETPSCSPQIVIEHLNLTPEELKACQCEYKAYVTALNDVEGISVLGGPPYTCQNVDCRQLTPAPIPTLSEWGLIAMAGTLGIIGFMVIRRRKATA